MLYNIKNESLRYGLVAGIIGVFLALIPLACVLAEGGTSCWVYLIFAPGAGISYWLGEIGMKSAFLFYFVAFISNFLIFFLIVYAFMLIITFFRRIRNMVIKYGIMGGCWGVVFLFILMIFSIFSSEIRYIISFIGDDIKDLIIFWIIAGFLIGVIVGFYKKNKIKKIEKNT